MPPGVGDSLEGTDEEFSGGALGKDDEPVACSLQVIKGAGY